MKNLINIIIILLAVSVNAQQGVDEILASNSLNNNKTKQSLMAGDFSVMEAEKLDGIYKLLTENGNVKEVRTFDNGNPDGTWLQYDDNQNLIAIANYKNSLKHGKWIIWDSNGVKRSELFYNSGERTGEWSIWNEEGELVSSKQYGL